MRLNAKLRHVAERFSRNRVLRRYMPKDLGGGPIFVSPDARLKLWRGDIEACDPHLFAAARTLIKPGMRIWDIGANVGLFTFSAQYLTGAQGHVLAVDADPWLVTLLQRSRSARGDVGARVDILCAAVSDTNAITRFQIAARGRASNALEDVGRTQMGGGRETLAVPSVTLDQLLLPFPRPELIKIDIEGAEGLAFASAEDALEGRPIMIIEVSESNAQSVTHLLHTRDYALYDISHVSKGAEINLAVANTVAIPSFFSIASDE